MITEALEELDYEVFHAVLDGQNYVPQHRERILIVGLGLIGGSYAKALKRLGYHVTAIDKRQAAIDYALENHIINDGSVEVEDHALLFGPAYAHALFSCSAIV